jgi:hypothetical protein
LQYTDERLQLIDDQLQLINDQLQLIDDQRQLTEVNTKALGGLTLEWESHGWCTAVLKGD